MRPKVAVATPISIALTMPCSSAIRGAQAIAVPCPPISETEPPRTPTALGNPSNAATEMPMRFCAKRKPTVTARRITRGLPPSSNSDSRALMPIVVKK